VIASADKRLSIKELEVFTTRPDTIFGVTFMVLAPEHALMEELIQVADNSEEIQKYVNDAKFKSELDRQQQKEKTGVEIKGVKIINPVNGKKIPLFVADYVLSGYGTGAIMGVPAHDERDFEFAKKYNLDIICVIDPVFTFDVAIEPKEPSLSKSKKEYNEIISGNKVYTGDGKVINSDFLNELNKKEAIKKIIIWLEENNLGNKEITYKLRDWSVSRQRFWGSPIPMLVNKSDDINTYEELPENVIQLHAWGSSPDEHFHKWLDQKLKNDGINTKLPTMPDAVYPTFDIGRSLSSWTVLKLAETHKLRKIIIACPTVPVNEWRDKLNSVVDDEKAAKSVLSFVFDNEIDFEKVAKNCGEIVFMLSTNDPYIPLKETQKYLEDKLPFAKFMTFRDAGHFSSDTGFDTFDKMYGEIVAEVRPDLKPLYTKHLPVVLPDDVDFKPTGQSPLTYSKQFQEGVSEMFGKDWEREVDTLDTFMCSSWYYFRYLDPHNDKEFASPEVLKKWMPVDFYLGGPEHVNGHLLYSRFFTKVLYDAGYIDFDEPFMMHRHQGMIEYGADTTRMYEMFMGPLEQSKSWSDSAVRGVRRFLDRIHGFSIKGEYIEDENKNKIELHKLLDKVSKDTENLKFNTAISEFMKFVNLVESTGVSKENWKTFIIALSPYAPFLTEEIWQGVLEEDDSIHLQQWPQIDESLLEQAVVTIAIQINGKVRGDMEISKELDQKDAENKAKEVKNVVKYLDQGTVVKVIYIKGRIINFIVRS